MSVSKLYVGNLPFRVTKEEVSDLFSQFGEIKSVNLITDKQTGRPKGFGFVEFESVESAQSAEKALDGKELGGRALRVNAAKEQERSRS